MLLAYWYICLSARDNASASILLFTISHDLPDIASRSATASAWYTLPTHTFPDDFDL